LEKKKKRRGEEGKGKNWRADSWGKRRPLLLPFFLSCSALYLTSSRPSRNEREGREGKREGNGREKEGEPA